MRTEYSEVHEDTLMEFNHNRFELGNPTEVDDKGETIILTFKDGTTFTLTGEFVNEYREMKAHMKHN